MRDRSGDEQGCRSRTDFKFDLYMNKVNENTTEGFNARRSKEKSQLLDSVVHHFSPCSLYPLTYLPVSLPVDRSIDRSVPPPPRLSSICVSAAFYPLRPPVHFSLCLVFFLSILCTLYFIFNQPRNREGKYKNNRIKTYLYLLIIDTAKVTTSSCSNSLEILGTGEREREREREREWRRDRQTMRKSKQW
ncbi:unnamed protein product [Xylocopa violacea]|uniref:Uncharacterized protein n=1 Tax=Xylocopa violacea TaxID=135666 RepID=A0ABP1NGC3_XYLVO